MPANRRVIRLAGFLLIALALLLGLYTLVGYLAWQSGESLRAERVQEERASALATQVTRAREEIERGNYRLALRRLEWVLEQDPAYPRAAALREVAQSALDRDSVPTPTLPPTSAAPATATPAAAVTSPSAEAPVEAFRALEALVEGEQWAEAITALTAFQGEFPNYQRRQTDRLLYQAYIGRGVELLYGERVELGLYYLAQAESLGDLPQEVRDQRQWAQLYLGGIAYYGVNWDVAIANFRDLCLAAPFYQDACTKLRTALVAYGDQFAVAQDWCPAESFYAEAYRVDGGRDLTEKLGQAREGCAGATPTASAPLTGTLPLSNTLPSPEE